MRHVVQQLAAFGRNGDNTLVHVNSDELQGLRNLARKHGRPDLTTNPHTGLPEAFNWWGIVPALGGAVATMYGGPAAGIAAGAALGGGIAKAQGSNVAMGALSGAAGGYGGGSAATGLAGMGATGAMAAPATDLAAAGASAAPAEYAGLAPTMGQYGAMGEAPIGAATSSLPQEAFRASEIAAQGAYQAPATSWENIQAGAQNLMDSPDKMAALRGSSMTLTNTALPLYAGIGMMPESASTGTTDSDSNPYKYKLERDRWGFQRAVPAMAEGGLTTLGTRPQYFGPMFGGAAQPSALQSLLSNPNFHAPAPLASRAAPVAPPSMGAVNAYLAPYQAQSMEHPSVQNVDAATLRAVVAPPVVAAPAMTYYPVGPGGLHSVGGGGPGSSGGIGVGNPGEASGMDAAAADGGIGAGGGIGVGVGDDGGIGAGGDGPTGEGGGIGGVGAGGDGPGGGWASGGITGVGQYLRGPGDGMSDHIPAQVGGPAGRQIRVAANEYVVPADVVSHLGNGSSDAGAKVLDRMGSKVRRARTGNPKQGKRINPGKFTPA